MKVFLSWSGDTSQKIATILRDWLPCVIQSLKPYVSSEDIKKGTRWSIDIAKELQETSFGILCVTKDNITAPWLNFEAGALSKAIETSHVVPFLFRLKPSDIHGPLLQFQITASDKDEILKLLETLNTANQEDRIDNLHLTKIFDVWWPKLQEELNSIPDTPNKDTKYKPRELDSNILEELLKLTRDQQRIITSLDSKFDKSNQFDDSILESRHLLHLNLNFNSINHEIEELNSAIEAKSIGAAYAIIEKIKYINDNNMKTIRIIESRNDDNLPSNILNNKKKLPGLGSLAQMKKELEQRENNKNNSE